MSILQSGNWTKSSVTETGSGRVLTKCMNMSDYYNLALARGKRAAKGDLVVESDWRNNARLGPYVEINGCPAQASWNTMLSV